MTIRGRLHIGRDGFPDSAALHPGYAAGAERKAVSRAIHCALASFMGYIHTYGIHTAVVRTC